MPAPEHFNYDPSKPIEPQIRAFLNGRNPYGQMSDPNWFKDPSLYTQYATPDESGTLNYGYRAKDPRLSDITPGAVGPEWNARIVDNQYTPVGWSASDSPDALNGLKPDSMYDYGRMYYDPRFGLEMDGNNVRDPSARHDAWYGAGLMAAVAGPAIYGILGAAGAAGGGAAPAGGAAGDESAGLLGTGSYNPGPGAFGDEATGLGTGSGGNPYGGIDTTPIDPISPQGTVPEIGNMTPYQGQPWYQSMLQNAMNNPQNVVRLGTGLYSMATANNQHPGSQGGNGPGGGLLDTSGMPQFNPMQGMGQFQQNPYLLAAMNNVPFMGGR